MLATTPDAITVLLWRVSDGKLLHTLKGHTDMINAVAFSSDGSVLGSASSDKTARLWSTENGSLLQTLQGHGAPVNCLAFSLDGRVLASGSPDHTVRLWSLN